MTTPIATHVWWDARGSQSTLAIAVPTHAPGLLNPNWPLCHEVEGLTEGWAREEIEDGELACCDEDDIQVAGRDVDASAPVDCPSCRELVHA